MSKAAIAFLVALCCPADARAGGQAAGPGTGSVVGVVTDVNGAALPKVSITITGAPLMDSRRTSTGADGTYHFTGLLPGEYTLTFESSDFAPVNRLARVGLEVALTLDVTLSLAPQRDEITVQANLDRRSTTIAQTFDARRLAEMPSSRNFGGLFALTHGLAVPVFEVGGGTGILSGGYGAFGRINSPRHTIEGIIVTGLFGAGFTPDYGSLQEAVVQTAAHGAEWPTAGIHTDFTTKSGSNRYQGTFYAATESRGIQSSNVDADQISRGASAGPGLSASQANQQWSYSDVNADVGGFVSRNRLWWYSSFRRQSMSSRLVNYPVAPALTELNNYTGKVTVKVSPRHMFVAYAQRGLNHQPNRLDPFGVSGSGLTSATAINESADSTVNQRNTALLWKGEWNAILSDSLMFTARAGQTRFQSDWKPWSASPRFEDIQTLVVRGGNRDYTNDSRRDQLFGTLSYFSEKGPGQHQVTVGAEVVRFLVRETWREGYPGNVLHVVSNGQPSSVVLFLAPSSSESGLWTYSAHASDVWRVNRRLTLTLGLRFDRYQLFLPAQEHPAGVLPAQQFPAVPDLAHWNSLVPRLAGALDVNGQGKTLVRFFYGRYTVAPNATTGFNSNPNSSEWWRQYQWADVNGNSLWEPGEEGRLLRQRGGSATESLDPALRLPVVDEAGAWLERALARGIRARTGVVWRRERFQFTRQNANQPFNAFTAQVPIPDPGPDGVLDTGDDGPVIVAYDLAPEYFGQPVRNVVANVPGANSRYVTWELSAEREGVGRWSFGGGLTYTWNRDQAGTYAGQAVRNNAYPLTPNDLINASSDGGYAFTSWTAKAYATFDGPWKLRITPVLRHQSGQPYGRTVVTNSNQIRYATVTLLAEPIGTRRMDNVTLVDVRVARTFGVKAAGLTAFVEVFNCLNANPDVNVVWSSGPSFLRPVTIVAPRIARFGLSVDW